MATPADATLTTSTPSATQRRRRSDDFANVKLTTHEGKRVRFVDDLVRSEPSPTVIIQFMYTHCEGICYPTSQNMARIHGYLRPRMGNQVQMYSITLDPARDTPAELAKYRARLGERKGWTFLTGRYDDIEQLRRSLGVYDLDPVIDADLTQHAGILTFGNDDVDRWTALPGEMRARDIAHAVLFTTRSARRS
jgi:protein SCO1/2